MADDDAPVYFTKLLAAILIWEFDAAPEELKALSKHGGDEDGIAFLPPGMKAAPYWLERIWDEFGPPQQFEYRGRIGYIWAHA